VTRALFLLLVAVVAVAGHDLTYLLVHGPASFGAALERSGHDAHWASAVSTVTVTVVICLAVAAVRLRALRRALRSAGTREPRSAAASWGPAASLAVRLMAASLATFVVQEAAESLATGSGFAGLEIVTGAGWISVPVFGAVAVLVAVATTLVTTRLTLMRAAVARAGVPRPRRNGPRGVGHDRPLPAPRAAWIRPVLGRAPPAGA
jgi:hypothetical protein